MSDFIIFGNDTGKTSEQKVRVQIQYDIYYEWIESLNKWIKLVDSDPDPVNIAPGKYDGQIIAVKR